MDTQWFDDVLVLLEERNMTRAALDLGAAFFLCAAYFGSMRSIPA